MRIQRHIAKMIEMRYLRRRAHTAVVLGILTVGAVGCGNLSGTEPLPAGISDPSALANPEGARAMYQSAVGAFVFLRNRAPIGGAPPASSNPQTDTYYSGAFLGAMFDGANLSDEIEPNNLGGPRLAYTMGDPIDARQVLESNFSSSTYTNLQRVRGLSQQAIGALATYSPADSALRGHLYALEGYAELLLADLFCSGIPLSELHYNGDWTLQAGQPTSAVYTHAAALFDTAITLSGDSVRFLNFARVGKGRALLALGRYASADSAVRAVPSAFTYEFLVDWSGGPGSYYGTLFTYNVSNLAGNNGIAYISGNDPRTEASAVQSVIDHSGDIPPAPPETILYRNQYGTPKYFPNKYGTRTSATPIIVASGIEAALIRAEFVLQTDIAGAMQQLNELRQANLPSPSATIPSALTRDQAIDTLFAERAKWLFLTAHRQGDLRRLIRQYNRPQATVYPTGPYPVFYNAYGTEVTLPVPSTEQQFNPNFHGCLSREA